MSSTGGNGDGQDPYAERARAFDACVEAIQAGRTDDLATLLDEGASFLIDGLALRATECESRESLEVLLRHGWNINTPQSYFEPPLLGKIARDSFQRGSVDMKLAQWFLDHKADPNAYAGQHARTPLSDAVRYGSFDLVKLLFDHGGSAAEGDLVYHLFTYQALKDRPEFYRKWNFLIERNAPINEALFERFPHLIDVTMFSYPPLVSASASGELELVKLLLAAGADPQKPSHFDLTPLRAAVDNGHEDVKRTLEEAIAMQPRL